jgi:8-oxo-dGTP pyrophosphatase MutT (NUDIX family)
VEARTLTEKIVCTGALFYSKATKRFLLIQKASGKHKGVWGLVGGTSNQEETAWQGLQREIQEEIGFFPNILKTLPLEKFVSNDNLFNFYTYLCIIEEEFIPILSKEHMAWAWTNLDHAPKPLHQGLKNSLSNKTLRIKLEAVFDIMDLI